MRSQQPLVFLKEFEMELLIGIVTMPGIPVFDSQPIDRSIGKPDYPALSRRRGETGTADVRFVVGPTGVIERVELAKKQRLRPLGRRGARRHAREFMPPRCGKRHADACHLHAAVRVCTRRVTPKPQERNVIQPHAQLGSGPCPARRRLTHTLPNKRPPSSDEGLFSCARGAFGRRARSPSG